MTHRYLFLAGALLATTTTAFAQGSDRPWLSIAGPDAQRNYVARLSISDLDLSTKEGARQLQHRVNYGISQVCWQIATDPGIHGEGSSTESQCRKATLSRIQYKIDAVMAAAQMGAQSASLQLSAPGLHRAK